jgi:hypothetical protein
MAAFMPGASPPEVSTAMFEILMSAESVEFIV